MIPIKRIRKNTINYIDKDIFMLVQVAGNNTCCLCKFFANNLEDAEGKASPIIQRLKDTCYNDDMDIYVSDYNESLDNGTPTIEIEDFDIDNIIESFEL